MWKAFTTLRSCYGGPVAWQLAPLEVRHRGNVEHGHARSGQVDRVPKCAQLRTLCGARGDLQGTEASQAVKPEGSASRRVRLACLKCNAKYYSVENQLERFRVFLELISRFEFEFCRRGNYIF